MSPSIAQSVEVEAPGGSETEVLLFIVGDLVSFTALTWKNYFLLSGTFLWYF